MMKKNLFAVWKGAWKIGVPMATLLCTLPARGHTEITGALVKRAIIGGVNYLLKHERSGRFWERGIHGTGPEGSFSERGGETALALESLLYVGQTLHLKRVNIFRPKIKAAIKYLCQLSPTGTYSVSYQANALALLPLKKNVARRLRWDQLYLDRAVHPDGAYSYAFFDSRQKDSVFASPADWDNSNSQYGVLGMWACIHALGRSAPYRYWRLIAEHWIRTQFPDGSWGYWGFSGRPPAQQPSAWRKLSMTPAGVASMLIADEYLQPRSNPTVLRGLRWIKHHFDPNNANEYSMYGFERVGLASGVVKFGRHDWYRDFVRTLINNQNNNGSWGGGFWAADPISGTAYALLILDRGLNPFFLSKLDYGHHYYGHWNRYHRDAANLVSWVTHTTDFPVNWQVVGFNAGLRNWLNSPILYITGERAPKFSAADIQMLRRFVQSGGLVLCSCNGGSLNFRNAMIKYGQMVVGHAYEFHRLARTSILYRMQPWYRKFFFNAFGMSNGVRYLWIVAPEDMGNVFQRHAFGVKNPWIFAENLYLYTTGKGQIVNRLSSVYVAKSNRSCKRHLHVLQLKYAGNWDPEPGAWTRYARISQRDFNTEIQYTAAAQLPHTLPHRTLLYVTGTAAVALAPVQIKAIQRMVHAGATVLADCAGGHACTARSLRSLMDGLVPDRRLQRIPLSSPLLNGSAAGSKKIKTVAYRKYFIHKHGFKTKPNLWGIRSKGRWVVIFSPIDIASGFLGTHTWGIDGYSPAGSTKLMRNIAAYVADNN